MEVVKFLIEEHGADPNMKEYDHMYEPIIQAAHSEKLDIIKILVRNGADTTVKDMNGKTAYEIAMEKNNTEMSDFLQQFN